MASSSSCSQSIRSSSSPSWTHDVFLSFRGEDTRKGFVGHLYTALEKEGIHTYKDDETLDRGESIGPSLLKAIEESRIAVIVFSKNYADSSWCLDELAHIIKCMDEKKQIVMPVFYDIDPSDVRKLKRKYGEAFDKHEWENKHRVESWKEALNKAGSISGWVTKDFANGQEAKCIEDIVDKISSRLFELDTEVNDDFIGIETRLQDLKAKLQIELGGVRFVGIWGVGGSGKTTLASVAYMEMSHQFKAHCLLQNIRLESSKHGLEKLQEKFLSLVLKINVRVESEIRGRSMIKGRLRNKNVLVVLDDVDDLKQLNALAGSQDWFGEGSRIIITTRDEHLLRHKGAMIHEMGLLSPHEATRLFCRHAYRKDIPKKGYENLTQDVVSYANGLPLALEVLGSFLYDKDKDEWKSALAELKCTPNDKVIKSLKISYDGLEPHRKGLFLDIACFMRGWKINKAMMVLDACSFYPRIGVRELIQKSLIKVSNGTFEMHDLVEEMARYIVRGEHPSNLEKHSRIWEVDDIAEFCDIVADAPSMETEVIDLKSDASDPRLPNVVANMKKLRWINWKGYPASSFPSHFKPTKLGYLSLYGGNQNQLWEGCKRLSNLKILHLCGLPYLTRTPDFEGLPCLERLVLHTCRAFEEIHPSIGYHNSLVYVHIERCHELKMFPPIISMKKLETFSLCWCERFQKFLDIRTSMDSLLILHLLLTKIEIIPESIGRFCTNLVSLRLDDFGKPKRIEADFTLLKDLKNLDLRGCKLLSQHSTSFDLSFHQESSMSRKVPQLPCFIRKLCLSACNLRDGDIPSDICELLNLQVLDLSRNQFSRLDSSLSRIPCLKFLKLSECKSLVQLPDLPSSIAILEAIGCDSLESVGDLSNYKGLWKVSLWRGDKLRGCGRTLHSMLQASASEGRFMNFNLPSERQVSKTSFTLQLPHNWHNDFSGFLFCVNYYPGFSCSIVIKQEVSTDSQLDNDHREEFDKKQESYEYPQVGYVPFGSLRHIPWWNSTCTKMISFEMQGLISGLFVRMVPRKSKRGDSRETSNATIMDISELWDEENSNGKTFEIKYDSRSSNIKIKWSYGYD